jgi:hypothetical protein
MSRPLSGTLHRFVSVTDLVAFCRARYPGADVRTVTERGDFTLVVDEPRIESLIVHFEGEGCYAVMLPEAAAS